MTPSIMLVSILFMGISMVVSMILKSKFSKYSKIPLANGMSGREIAEKCFAKTEFMMYRLLLYPVF